MGLDTEVCAACVANQGLCARHESSVLPQLARNIGWLKLMGEAQVEQVSRQRKIDADPAVSDAHAAHLERKRLARRSRRGIKGFLLALSAA